MHDIPSPVPSVLVLMATYNGAAFIEEQLASVFAQIDVQVTVAIGDDGSTDDTVARAEALATVTGGALSVIRHEPPMRSASQNFFALLASTDLGDAQFVAFCDQDDVWEDDHLARAVAEMHRVGADFYSCNTLAFWPDGKTREISKNFPQRRYDYLFESASQGCTYVFRAEAARRFADFVRAARPALKPVQYHDWLLYAWARSRELPWTMDGARRVRYRQSHANVIGANAGLGAVRRRLAMLRSGWLREQALCIITALGLQDHPVHARLHRFGWFDRLWLAGHARQSRRRPREALLFGAMLLLFGI